MEMFDRVKHSMELFYPDLADRLALLDQHGSGVTKLTDRPRHLEVTVDLHHLSASPVLSLLPFGTLWFLL